MTEHGLDAAAQLRATLDTFAGLGQARRGRATLDTLTKSAGDINIRVTDVREEGRS